jgi:hypothetical protein
MRPVPAGTTLLMNATQLGCAPEMEEVPQVWDTLDPACVVVDVITNPRITPFLATARQRGCPIVDGVEMVVQLAMQIFEQWTGVIPEEEVFQRAVEQALGETWGGGLRRIRLLCAGVVAGGGTKASGVVVRSPCPFPASPCRNRPRLPALLQGAATRRRVRQTHSSRNSPGLGWIALASSRPSVA